MRKFFSTEEIDYVQARAIKEALERMFESEGWAVFTDFVESRVAGRQAELYDYTPETVEQMVRFARMKGGLEELKLLPTMLHQIHSDCKELVFKTQEAMEEDEPELNLGV